MKSPSIFEKFTNKMPDPFLLFAYMLGIVFVLSFILGKLGVSAINPSTGDVIAVVNLLDMQYLGSFISSMGSTFISFPAMVTVPICALGMGIATHSGLLGNTLKLAGETSKSKWLLTFIIAFIGCNGNLAGDVALYIYPVLVAALFCGVKRNPIAGILLACASTTLGFGTNVMISSGELILVGMTESAARIIDPAFEAQATMGYFFFATSTIFVSAILTVICIKFVEPRLARLGIAMDTNEFEITDSDNLTLTDIERKGIKNAGIALIIFTAVVIILCLPNMPLGAPETKTFTQSLFFKAIATLIFFLFAITGYVYGKTVGTIKNLSDASKMMGKGISDLSSFFVISFAAAIFLQAFTDSQLASVLAINGGNALSSTGMNGLLMLIIFIAFTAFINLFIGSATAKWALFATIFVPMFMMNGINPAAIHVAYRIGDGMTNAMSPISATAVVAVATCNRYDKRFQIGNFFSQLAPLALGGGILFALWFVLWSLLGILYGPGYTLYLL